MSEAARTGRPRGHRPYEFNAQAAISARLEQGLTLREVSARCRRQELPPVNDSNLAKYERGDVCPSPQTLVSLARVLGLQVSDLITFRGAGDQAQALRAAEPRQEKPDAA